MQSKNTDTSNPATETSPTVKAKPKALKTVSGQDKPVVVKEPVGPAKKPVKKEPVKTATKAPVKEVAKVAEFKPELPAAIQIWNAIKDRELGLFGLAGQTVSKYCTPLSLDPTRCMLKYKVSSVIPALEMAVPDFDFEVSGAYLVISKKKAY